MARPIDLAAASPFRLCFRLEEPSEGFGPTGTTAGTSATCSRRPTTQPARAGRRRLGPAGAAAAVLTARSGFRPREYLLATLGQAVGALPADRGEPEGGRPRRLRHSTRPGRTTS